MSSEWRPPNVAAGAWGLISVTWKGTREKGPLVPLTVILAGPGLSCPVLLQVAMCLSNDRSHKRFPFPLGTLFSELGDVHSPVIHRFPL